MKLKNCPFCKTKPTITRYGFNKVIIKCHNYNCLIYVSTLGRVQTEKAFEAWNDRGKKELP